MGIIAGWLAQVISFVIILFFIRAIVSWLFVFGVRNDVLVQISQILSSITEPILAPIRRYVPSAGGLDLSFLVVIFGLMFIQRVLLKLA